ncbi:MAG: hypothetical protein JO227_21210 [Acetobacteraceae bacterium]|nr:hypothetical protein [Acetobacteraceae bacterium]
MRYLGKLPDARLMAYFEDTHNRIADGVTRPAIPPCASYAAFLTHLSDISAAFQAGRVPEPLPPGRDGSPPLAPEAFIYWTRDFLAAIAAPATAESILLTENYVIRRTRRLRLRWLPRRRKSKPPPADLTPAVPNDPDEAISKLQARRLAAQMWRYEWGTIAVVFLTVVLSIYALSGRLILGSQKDAKDAWTKVDEQVQLQEDKIFPAAQLPVTAQTRLGVQALCDYVEKPVINATAERVVVADASASQVGTAPANPGARLYLSALQAHLCAERAELKQSLFVVTMHLQSWSSVVTQRLAQGLKLALWSYPLQIRAPVGPLFGVVPTTLKEHAQENNGELCMQVAPEMVKTGISADSCEKVLWTLINESPNVAESILGSITQYILPVCYGFLGAMAAALRVRRRKVDASLLSPTDRSRLLQGAILGVLCGGVIGLFASYVGKPDSGGGLGLSAFALLAGYNVDGVFRFLDELSDRIFRPGTPVSQLH